MVHTDNGFVPIEDVKLSDKIYALDPGQAGYYEVVYLTNHPVAELLYLTIDGEIMEVTPDHPIYIEGQGWVEAGALTVGDRLRRIDGGWAAVLAIERVVLDAPEVVYNFTVKGVHTYFVLEAGVLVHNCYNSSLDYSGFPRNTVSSGTEAHLRHYGSAFQNTLGPVDNWNSFQRVTKGVYTGEFAGSSHTAWKAYKRTNRSDDIIVFGRRDDVRPWDNISGYETLNFPGWNLRVNDAWMQGGIDRGAKFSLVSPIRLETLWDGLNLRPTVLARELEQLRLAGYRYSRSGNSIGADIFFLPP